MLVNAPEDDMFAVSSDDGRAFSRTFARRVGHASSTSRPRMLVRVNSATSTTGLAHAAAANSASHAANVAAGAGVGAHHASPLALEFAPLLMPTRGRRDDDFELVGDDEMAQPQVRSLALCSQLCLSLLTMASKDTQDDVEMVEVKQEDDAGSMAVSRANSVTAGEQSDSSYVSASMVPMPGALLLAPRSNSTTAAPSPAPPPPTTMTPAPANGPSAAGVPLPDHGDWNMHLDLDELDLELGAGLDLLGPESVGLEELDLVWGTNAAAAAAAAKQGDAVIERWRDVASASTPAPVTSLEQQQQPHVDEAAPPKPSSSSSFMTGSPKLATPPTTEQQPQQQQQQQQPKAHVKAEVAEDHQAAAERVAAGATASASTSTAASATPTGPPASNANMTTAVAAAAVIGGGGAGPSSCVHSIDFYPLQELRPSVTATIVCKVPVYKTVLVSSAAVDDDDEDDDAGRQRGRVERTLLRRIDTDYVNASVLLADVVTDDGELAKMLERHRQEQQQQQQQQQQQGQQQQEQQEQEQDEDVVVVAEATHAGARGTWVPLSLARTLAAAHARDAPQLAALSTTFLDANLGALFPEPIPTLRHQLRRTALKTADASPFGVLQFDGGVLDSPPPPSTSASPVLEQRKAPGPPPPPPSLATPPKPAVDEEAAERHAHVAVAVEEPKSMTTTTMSTRKTPRKQQHAQLTAAGETSAQRRLTRRSAQAQAQGK